MASPHKRSKREHREQDVLMGLVSLYIEMGKPIGSHTLQEHGFDHLSSATIRNYCAELEKKGYILQQHTSGGRIPSPAGYRLYAQEGLHLASLKDHQLQEKLQTLSHYHSREVTSYLQQSCELLSEMTGYATFYSSVRFDQDLILDVKLVLIDSHRMLCILITEFGQIYTELLSSEEKKFSSFGIKRIESYFQWRIRGVLSEEKPVGLSPEEEELAIRYYNEVMVRYIVRYSNFSAEDVYRTGFSRLLSFGEFKDPVALASSLSLFEDTSQMRLLLSDCARSSELRFWVGTDLSLYASSALSCSVIAIPYRINQRIVGAFGILGPCRMPYHSLFALLRLFSESISEALTKTLYTFKLSFRQPRMGTLPFNQTDKAGERSLIEIKTKSPPGEKE